MSDSEYNIAAKVLTQLTGFVFYAESVRAHGDLLKVVKHIQELEAALAEKDKRIKELEDALQAWQEEYPLCLPNDGCGKCDRLRSLATKETQKEEG